jgi:putative transposase
MTVVSLRKGAKVQYSGQTMKVMAPRDLHSVVLQDDLGHFVFARIEDLVADANAKAPATIPVDFGRLQKVERYRAAFRDVLTQPKATKAEVKKAGQFLGIGVSAAYEALARFRETGDTNDLPPSTRPGGKGKSRIDPAAEAIIKNQIKKIVLTRRNFSRRNFYKKTKELLEKMGHKVCASTLRNRLRSIDPYDWVKARSGSKKAKRSLDPHKGQYPDIAIPLQVIQIDHWKIDCEILDDDRKDGIGRAWATIGIDINTRTVWGFYVGLDDPSTTSVAFCMINGMLRKEALLKEYDIKTDMPIWGDPETLHLDNAGEFTGKSMRESCKHFNINLKYRPVGEPQYGSHIERLNKNLADRFKDLPGATGSNPEERKELQPEKTAVFTLDDLTRQFWLMIAQYHNEPHSGLGGKTPLEKWKEYYEGPEGPRRPLPTIRVDDLSFRLHWYPLERRKLDRHGIRVDYLDYYNDDLQFLIRNKEKYGWIDIRRDPLDIRRIYVLHPIRKEWIIVPTRHLWMPIASLFELKAAKREARRRKLDPTPQVLMELIEEERRHVDNSEKLTKKARRQAARRAHHKRLRKAAPRAEDDENFNREAPAIRRTKEKPAATQPTARNSHSQEPSSMAPCDQEPDLASLLANVTDEQLEDLLNGA